ncbi:MAG TPA: HupE/UreJ family protein, partial [Verrucomicrobiae bacterium]|nr:HupE/UreJ family protein [Verrucomicrobiae bacterium]
LPAGGNAALYSVGFVISTGLLHAVGIALGLVHRWPAGKIALRVSGAVVCLGGCFFLWNAIA